jgi:hypothetical protein
MSNPSIVLTVCEECGIAPEEFFGPYRERRMTEARRIAAERLQAAGFCYASIGRLIRRSHSAVQYLLKPGYREARRDYYKRRNASRKKMCGHPPDSDARKIFDAILAEFQIAERDFVNSKFPEHVKVRRAAICRLGAAGMSMRQISRVTGCERTSVAYWLKPEFRERVKLRRIASYYREVGITNATLGKSPECRA